MAFSEFFIWMFIAALPPYHGFIGILKIAVYFGLPEYHGTVSYLRSPFILACLCIMASSVLPYHCLFWFRHSITASVFISYHRVSRTCGLYRLNHLSWLFSYSSLRCILASVSWFNEPKNISARWVSFVEKNLALSFDNCPGWQSIDSAREALYTGRLMRLT